MKRVASGLCPVVLALALAGSCSDAPAPAGATPGAPAAAPRAEGPPWFEDVARAQGVVFDHLRGLEQRFWFPETIASGVGWIDYDGDGRLDLFAVQAGDLDPRGRPLPGDRLYRNLGDGRFEDVTERAGIVESAYGMGCAVGDYDGDGDSDLYVTNVGPDALWRNEGDGTFREVAAEAGVAHPGWGTSAGFFDHDLDGDLDLFVVHYVRWSADTEIDCKSSYGERDYCAPKNYNRPSSAVLYRNEGGGRFRDVSEEAGLLTVFGNGLGLALCDFDGDGWLDAYVSNDGNPNQLWINQKDGRFVDKAVLAGAAVNRNGAPEASMGTVAADVDQDGWQDLFITNLRNETNILYLNQRGQFTDVTPRTGLALPSLQFTGFGDGLFDFDLDGLLDLYVANGRVGYWEPVFSKDDPYAEPDQLFRGKGGLAFEEVFPRGGTREDFCGNSRGVAFADYDEDGDVDLAVLENHGPLRLLRNIAPRQGHHVSFALVDERGQAVPGAACTLELGAVRRHGLVAPCSSFCSSNDPRVHFGLGPATRVERIVVRWPGGAQESYGPCDADRVHVLRRGSGQALPR